MIAVIYMRSHVDHFGGVFGVTSQDDVDAGQVQVIAPECFTAHAVEENVYAGTAMSRRAGCMYGAALARGPQGQVGAVTPPGVRPGPGREDAERRGWLAQARR